MIQRILLAPMLAAALAGLGAAQVKIWTHAGSAGAVDESSSGQIRLVQGEATLQPSAPDVATAIVRFNVVALDGLFVPPSPTSWPAMGIRYRDNGAGARVIATLKSYDYTTGITTKVLVFDSDRYPPTGAAYQTRAIGDCSGFRQLDFTTKAYFVEVELVKTAAGGDPGVGVVQLSRYGVCPSA
jgi:hypothetical protein